MTTGYYYWKSTKLVVSINSHILLFMSWCYTYYHSYRRHVYHVYRHQNEWTMVVRLKTTAALSSKLCEIFVYNYLSNLGVHFGQLSSFYATGHARVRTCIVLTVLVPDLGNLWVCANDSVNQTHVMHCRDSNPVYSDKKWVCWPPYDPYLSCLYYMIRERHW